MDKKDEKHNFTQYSDVLSTDIKNHNRHMITKGRRVRNIDPFSEDKKDIRLIHNEAKVNPWYVYRNYLSNEGEMQLYKEDYSSAYCIFNNVNTWVNDKSDSPHDYTNIIKALVSLSFTNKSGSTIIYVKDTGIVKKVEAMIEDEIYKLPTSLWRHYRSHNVISVASSFPPKATWLAHLYDNIVILDLYNHVEVSRFVTLHNEYKNKNFIITTNELGNEVRDKDAVSLKFKNTFCLKWSDYAYDFSGRGIYRRIRKKFLLHDYNY